MSPRPEDPPVEADPGGYSVLQWVHTGTRSSTDPTLSLYGYQIVGPDAVAKSSRREVRDTESAGDVRRQCWSFYPWVQPPQARSRVRAEMRQCVYDIRVVTGADLTASLAPPLVRSKESVLICRHVSDEMVILDRPLAQASRAASRSISPFLLLQPHGRRWRPAANACQRKGLIGGLTI